MKKIVAGKVRNVYEVSENELVIVTTDRVSAFDVILPTLVPEKGKILNQLSSFWFSYTKDIIENHILSEDLADMPAYFQKPEYEGRTVLVKKLRMLPYEFIVRGYIFGHMWEGYETKRSFCGYTFDREYKLAEKLETPILTPSTKSEHGHDEYITMDDVRADLGDALTDQIIDVSMRLYDRCAAFAREKNIIIADTKLEFGLDSAGKLVLGDEIFTPDSSRFWDAADYRVGQTPNSLDKQYLRDWLIANHMDGQTPPPAIPEEIIEKTTEKYKKCMKIFC